MNNQLVHKSRRHHSTSKLSISGRAVVGGRLRPVLLAAILMTLRPITGVGAETSLLLDTVTNRFSAEFASGVLFSPEPRHSLQRFDFALTSFRVSAPLGQSGDSGWWRGRWELAGEAFGGPIIRGDGDYIVGSECWLRYSLDRTFCRLRPFGELGFGIAFTDASDRIVGQTLNFVSGAALGIKARVAVDAEITLEYRALHISNGGLSDRNRGINVHGVMLGISWRL
jgi:hypothetical protein